MANPNPVLISNQVLLKPQNPTHNIKETTGEIVYANEAAGIGKKAMPQIYRGALNDDYGEPGNNLIVQLRQKIQGFPDGPWYVDSKDGVIYIHNRKLQEPPRASYTYQGEMGDLLSVSFETQYVKKALRASTEVNLDPNTKGLNTVLTVNKEFRSYLDYYDSNTGNWRPNTAINAYNNGLLSYDQLIMLDNRIRSTHQGKSAFTENQWIRINSIRYRKQSEQRMDRRDSVQHEYEIFQSQDYSSAKQTNINRGINETLERKDLEANVVEFFTENYGESGTRVLSEVMNEVDEAAREGTLDQMLKRRFSKTMYTFRNKRTDGGALVEAWIPTTYKNKQGSTSIYDVDKSPNMVRMDKREGIRNDGTIRVFAKVPVQVTISGYRLIKAYATRKMKSGDYDKDLSRRVLTAANNNRRITERKLMAKATVVGNPYLTSSHIITLSNLGERWSGNWYIKKCIHKIEGSSGYTTEMELVRHRGVEGYQTAVHTESPGHDSSHRSTGGSTMAASLANISLSHEESIYYNSVSTNLKEDLIIDKLAGVRDAVIIEGSGRSSKNLHLRVQPTAEQRRKYGRAAAKAVAAGIKAKPGK